MEKDINKLVEGYKNYTGSDVKVHKTPSSHGMTLSKSDLKEPQDIYNYRSFAGQLVRYTNKVRPDVQKLTRELSVHMFHPGPEHWKVFGRRIVYLK